MKSMTGFAALERTDDATARSWDLRSVNARGLDIRMRLPEGIEGLETAARAQISAVVGRGNVSLSLKVTATDGAGKMSLNAEALAAALRTVQKVQEAATAQGMSLAPPSAADILNLRGVLDTSASGTVAVSLDTLQADLAELIAAFDDMRADEGAALHEILTSQLDEIARLTDAAFALAEERGAHMGRVFAEAVARLRTTDTDPEKVAHDIAALAVKADVTEEIDRLRAHVNAARALLNAEGPVGRKLDFLTQEFNREANTLCSKAQFSALTEIGLSLKTVIDQMREQVQNVE